MATLEDKILGEKAQYYCSSSEESDNDQNDDDEPNKPQKDNVESAELPDINKWEGTSTNTGPKGVIKDWQRYKQLENEKRIEDDTEKIELMKKLTLTVRTSLDEEREKAALEDPELAELLNDDFLIAYQKQRMQEMIQNTNYNFKFGDLIFLQNGQEFLDAIDKEHKAATIIVHIYEDTEACRNMNVCLKSLCKLYVNVKFCCIKGSAAGISQQFKADGVPALLVYKAGNLVGNFVRLSDELGSNFLSEDVQNYLVEHGLLEDKSCTPKLVSSTDDAVDSD
ncbi:phosducin-like protein [Diabrotica virgifera virgifera]|uniref:Phosducin-like protein n=1 Tax=Diabrotica virgifera virgifera TaxID=50390 RepID=A0A6P7GXJ9_DIAVI|nr:phosducin-like protein [Diabrotica virgifera virgifera]